MTGLSRVIRMLRHSASVLRDVQVVIDSVEQSSVKPIIRRLYNKAVGRAIHSNTNQLFWTGRRGQK